MKLKKIYEKIYSAVFSLPLLRRLIKIPLIEKLFQYEVISYLFFGVLTTVVNFAVYGIANAIAGEGYETAVLFEIAGVSFKWIYLANAIAWIAAVLFAYITNKLFVFESRGKSAKTVTRELISFFGARIISFLLFEELLFALLTGGLKINSWLAKIAASILTVIFNYIASKLVIFKNREKQDGESTS